jgi:hypothetical protein
VSVPAVSTTCGSGGDLLGTPQSKTANRKWPGSPPYKGGVSAFRRRSGSLSIAQARVFRSILRPYIMGGQAARGTTPRKFGCSDLPRFPFDFSAQSADSA